MTNRPINPSRPVLPQSAIAIRPSAIRRGALALLAAFTFGAAAHLAHSAPLALDDAIKLALQNNQRVKVSAFGPEIGKANVLAAYGAFDPVLTFRRNYREDETPGVLTP